MKFSHVFFCILFLSLVACEKEENNNLSSVGLEGKWNLNSITCNDGTTTTTLLGASFTTTYTTFGKNFNASITFTGNEFKSLGTYTAVTTSILDGETFVSEQTLDYFENDGTWVRDGNFIVFTVPGNPDQRFEILKLDSNSFEYKAVANETIDQGDGVVSTVKGTYIFKLSK